MNFDYGDVAFKHIEDIDAILALGVKAAPVLMADGTIHCGPEAIKWFTNWAKEHAHGN